MEFSFKGAAQAESPLEAKLLALLKGVSLCINREIKRLILEGD